MRQNIFMCSLPDFRDLWKNGVDVGFGRAEIHHAGTQQIVVLDDGVRYEKFTGFLNLGKYRRIEFI